MSHALVRTNEKGVPFRGRCIKCGAEGLSIAEGAKDCPEDVSVSDEDALLSILNSEPTEHT